MNPQLKTSRPVRRSMLAALICATAAVLTACGSAAGTATIASSTTSVPQTTGHTIAHPTTSSPTEPTGTVIDPTTGSTTPPVSTASPTAPPTCEGTPNKLVTPTTAPIITVTAGANSWISNWTVEPLALAVYSDGTAIISHGIGERASQLPAMSIGYIPDCTLAWAQNEIAALAKLDLGQSGITDQGTTIVTYTPKSGSPAKISVYALGVGDQYVQSGKENRARLRVVLAELRTRLDGAATWTPDRLRIVQSTGVGTTPTPLTWPGTGTFEQLLTGKRGSNACAVITGDLAGRVLKELGSNDVDSRWTDGKHEIGLQVGVLVPGQDGCTDS